MNWYDLLSYYEQAVIIRKAKSTMTYKVMMMVPRK